MNRRSFIAGVSLLACGSRAALAGNTFEALQPVDSLRRDFLNGKVDVPADEVRSLVSCAYDMRSEAEAGSAIELLIASAQDSMGFEISIGETTAIPVASPEASTSGWFVTYPT